MRIYLFKNKKETAYALIFSFLCAFINLSCAGLTAKFHLTGKEVLIIFLESLVAMIVGAEFILRIRKYTPRFLLASKETEAFGFIKREDDLKYFLLSGAVIFLLWIPVLLAFYPGIFAYDVTSQLQQIMFNEYSTHHPLLHTLYLGFFYNVIGGKVLHNYTLGLALASIAQMLAISFSIAYCQLFLRRAGVRKWFRYLCIAFCGLCPFFPILAISTTKDVMFAGFFAMLLVSMLYFEFDYDFATGSLTIKIMFALSLVLTVLYRSNGRYAVWAMAAVAVLKFIRRNKKAFLVLLIGSVIFSEVLGAALKLGFKATSPDKTEMLSIPIQQLCFVYELNYETLSVEEKQVIETLIPLVINYNRVISDPTKFTTQYVDNKKLFWSTYLKYLKSHPRQYVEAFLQNNLGFLYIGDKTNASIYGESYERRRGFLMTYTRDDYDIHPTSCIPALEDLYIKLYCQNDYQKNLITFLPCSMGLYFWIIVLCIFKCLEKKKKCLSSLFLVLALGGTTLLGPCAIIRYMLPYIVCVPTLIVAANVNTEA